MRVRSWIVPIGVVTLLLTSGCAGPVPEPVASGSAAAGEAFFASEEEAVEAAQLVLDDYIAAINEVLADGGVLTGQLDGIATEELIDQQDSGFEEYRSGGLTLVGRTTVDSFEVQQYIPLAEEGSPVLVAYFCRDVSATDVLNDEGDSMVPAERPLRLAFQAEFIADPVRNSLTIAGDEQWQSGNFCA